MYLWMDGWVDVCLFFNLTLCSSVQQNEVIMSNWEIVLRLLQFRLSLAMNKIKHFSNSSNILVELLRCPIFHFVNKVNFYTKPLE